MSRPVVTIGGVKLSHDMAGALRRAVAAAAKRERFTVQMLDRLEALLEGEDEEQTNQNAVDDGNKGD